MWVVYEHRNKKNGKVYIGITHQIPSKRWGLKGSNYKDSPKFWKAIEKYGWNEFEHNILFENLTESEAKSKEIELIAIYKSKGISYNLSDGGDGVVGVESKLKGKHLSEETKRKISESSKGKPGTNTGKKFTEEHRRKISESLKGKPMCENAKKKILGWNKGIPHTQEHKEKISKGLTGKKRGPLSEEHKKKLSEAHKGKKYGPLSDERKQKISKARKGQQIGRRLTDEWKEKIKKGMKKYWNSKKSQNND